MPVRKVRFLAAARAELLEETKYYARIRPELGSQFLAAVERSLATALAFPFSGSPAADDTRRMLVKRFPYSVVYQVIDDGVMVVAVAHHAREPVYWRGRDE